jgi:hypothetical protein
MDHRAQLLTNLTQRRDAALAQLRELLAGRDLLVETIDQVRLTASGLVGELQDISASPASFVSLDPSIEGPGDAQQEGVSLSVTRERRSSRARRSKAATLEASPAAEAGATDAPVAPAAPASDAPAGAEDAPAASEDPITAELPVIVAGAPANGTVPSAVAS